MPNTKLIFWGVVGFIANASAGTMADINSNLLTNAVYASVEGGWTSNQLKGLSANILDVGSIYTIKQSNKGSFRASMGARKNFKNNFAALGEIGYGYYGKTSFKFQQFGPVLSMSNAPDFSQVAIDASIDGFDVLAGLSYQVSNVVFSVKAGGIVENARYKPSVNLSKLSSDIQGAVYVSSNLTQVFPETKLEVAYQLLNNLSLTAAWTHVFGENPSVDLTINPSFPPGFISIKTQNPALNVFTLGATYFIPV